MLLEWLKWTNKIILCSQTGEILLEAIFEWGKTSHIFGLILVRFHKFGSSL